MGESISTLVRLQFDRRVHLEFHGAMITSDAGLLTCRDLDGALRLTEVAPIYLRKTRGGRNVQHELVPLLGCLTAAWHGGILVTKGDDG